MRKRLFIFILLLTIGSFISGVVLAGGPVPPSPNAFGHRRQQEKPMSFIDKLKEKIKNLFGPKTGKITAIKGDTITIKTSDGREYTINVSPSTILKRRFGGKSEFSEFSQGDRVNVVGKWTNDSKTVLDARHIRDSSIQKRWGVFFGDVNAKNNDNFVMKTKRGTENVFFGSAKFVNIKQEAITYDNVAVGHKVRVKGTWDRKLNKIFDVSEVKDFSLK